jgi:uncharacterized membrane protein (DUF485 family)
VLKKYAFANAAAAVSALCYVAMYVLSMVAPVAFKMVFNAQFMGANLAPAKTTFDVGALIAIAVSGWVVGYVFVWFYDRWA